MTYQSEVLADSPYLYYRLEENPYAGTASDSSGNTRHGTYPVSTPLGYRPESVYPRWAQLAGFTANGQSLEFGPLPGSSGMENETAVPSGNFAASYGTLKSPSFPAHASFTVEGFYSTRGDDGEPRWGNLKVGRALVGHEPAGTGNIWMTTIMPIGGFFDIGTYNTATNYEDRPSIYGDGYWSWNGSDAIYPARRHWAWSHQFTGSTTTDVVYVDGVEVYDETMPFPSSTEHLPSTESGFFFVFGFNAIGDEIAYYDHVLSGTRIAAHAAAAPILITGGVGQLSRPTLSSTGNSIIVPQRIYGGIGSIPALSITDSSLTVTSGATLELVGNPGAGSVFALDLRMTVFPGAVDGSSVPITVIGGLPATVVEVRFGGVLVAQGLTDSDGNLVLSVPLAGDLAEVGTHTLDLSQSTDDLSAAGSVNFSVTVAPATLPTAPELDAAPEGVSAGPSTSRKWVFQDPSPGGLGSYVLPINPRDMTSPHFEHSFTSRHTTAHTGRFHIFEAAMVPKEWEFGGYCPTEEMQEKLLQFRNLNRRIYIIDHHGRAWKVAITHLDITPRLRHVFNGEVSDWGSDFRMTVVVLNQEPTLVP